MTVSGVFTETQWIWLLLGTAFVFWEPFAAKLHTFWDFAIFPKPEKATPLAPEETQKMTSAQNRLVQYRRDYRWFYGYVFPAIYVIAGVFTVASLIILATEYSALVNLHHEQTYTLLMAFFVTSVVIAKTIPLLLHWTIYGNWKWVSFSMMIVNLGISTTTIILLGIKDTDPRVAVAAGLFVPFVAYELIVFVVICILIWKGDTPLKTSA
jgi:hypothetical protein